MTTLRAETVNPALRVLLDHAEQLGAVGKDENGERVLIGLTRAETIELGALMVEDALGGSPDVERARALQLRFRQAHCEILRAARAAPKH